MGVACPLAGSVALQSSRPVVSSKAWRRLSLLAPIKTMPPAVTIDPPMFGVRSEDAISPGKEPSGTRQRIEPSERSSAVNDPHGGFWQG